jgi:hypothetical protein
MSFMLNMRQITHLLCVVLLLGNWTLAAVTDPKNCGPDNGAEKIEAGGGASCSSFDYENGCPLDQPSEFLVHRVVGRGLVSEGDASSDGTLLNAQELIDKGILAPNVYVEVSYTAGLDGFSSTGSGGAVIEIGGRVVANLSLNGLTQSGSFCVELPAETLKYGRRVDPREPPIPGRNFVRAVPSGTPWLPSCEDCGFSVSVNGIWIKTLHPVVFVHGIRSTTDHFKRTVIANPPSTGLLTPFIEEKTPYVLAMDPSYISVYKNFENNCKNDPTCGSLPVSTIGRTGDFLAKNLSKYAERFGTDRVHIVGHSKGGLWARAAMSMMSGSPARSTFAYDTSHSAPRDADRH